MERKVLNSYECYTIMGKNQRERNLMLRHITLMVIVSVQRLNTLYHLDQKDRLEINQTVKNFLFLVANQDLINVEMQRFLDG